MRAINLSATPHLSTSPCSKFSFQIRFSRLKGARNYISTYPSHLAGGFHLDYGVPTPVCQGVAMKFANSTFRRKVPTRLKWEKINEKCFFLYGCLLFPPTNHQAWPTLRSNLILYIFCFKYILSLKFIILIRIRLYFASETAFLH